jgi:hypothetical protein
MEHLAATNRLDLAIGLPLSNPEALGQFLHQLYDPASPNYRRYLTPEQFTERFGPTERDYQAVNAFAASNGLRVTTRHANRLLLDVSGSVANVERAFHLKMFVYQHPTEARTFYAPDTEPALDLAVPLLSISGLDNYSPPRPLFVRRPLDRAQRALPDTGSGPEGYYMGKDFRAAYVPDTSLTGSGQTVGLLQFDGYTASDITSYETLAGLPNVTLSNVLLDGFSGYPTRTGGEVEVSLDIEMAISMAPGLSKVIVYEAGPYGNWHDILNRMADDNLAKQLSCSWYIPGGGPDPVAEQIFQQMAAQGQSFFAASGDYDAYTGLIPFPSDTTNVTEVGGTLLTTSGPGGSWVGETAWNRNNGIGTAGGISTSYTIPSWQTNISMRANQGSTTMHNVPDVAMTADDVYVQVDGEGGGVGGTSCAAPLWAGFTALVNEQAVLSGRPTVGFINPALDLIASSPIYTACFHDTTNGNNTSPSSPTRFFAVSGYDLCTGWGSPAGQNLINALAIPDPLGVQPGAGFTAIGGSGGPFTVTSESFVLTNSGTNSLTWSLVSTSTWLAVSPPGGTLLPGGSDFTPLISLGAGAYSLPIGNYTATVAFSNDSSGIAQSRQFMLQVVPSVPPAIQTPPANQVAAVGANASFSVVVSGTPPMVYQWQFDGANIIGATNTSLTLTNVSLSQAGSYAVTVTNTLGSNSAAATLTVGYAPSITVQPQDQQTVQGSNVTFSVTAAGTGPLSYQWYFYSTALAQATNPILTVSNAQATNGGLYNVAVSSPFGAILSSNATLTVELFPIIVTQPQNQYGDIGSNVTFSVTATGSSSVLPVIGSGTLQLWLKADTGVVTNSAGLVSLWQDQSGNANDADQAATALQPTLALAAGLGGKPVVRFNGIQDNVNGSYMFGSGNVGVPNAITAFTVYNAFSTVNKENLLWLIGVPGEVYGASRCDDIIDGDLLFSTWADQYGTSFVIPTNTYRIWIDRLDTNLDTLNMFDVSPGSATNFTAALNGTVEPAAGYYVGGLDSSLPFVGSSRCFNGDIAELICYRGYLTEADRIVVVNYLEAKYYQLGASGTLSYQWLFNGTNIAGATNASLTLTNAQFTNEGVYSVTVSNLVGVTISSNAALVMGYAPSITAQPQSLEVKQNVNVSFTVTAAGTGPLGYQWYFNGDALPSDTNSTLTLTNVQAINGGSYSVLVSSPFGSILNSNATLIVDLFPVIVTQPQSQDVLVGTNVTFSVAVAGSNAAPTLPTVTSGTLQLWLKADAGVVTNSSGKVSQWQDQSGNANHASQANANEQPLLVSATGLGGKPAVRFNGIQDNVHGSYLFGAGQVNVPNAMTLFTFYNAFATTNSENLFWLIGVPGRVYGASRSDDITGGDLLFSTWSYVYNTHFVIPTNTYRIWINRMDTNLDTLNMFDVSSSSATNFTASMSGTVAPAAGYYVGGLNPALTYVGSSRCFNGDVVESLCYQGYLTETDRLAVVNYLEQKYYQGGTTGNVSYQWQLNGTNIANATNASLTLSNVQITNDGVYTVTISNLIGVTTSSNAMLVVGYAPSITAQPQSLEAVQGTNVLFAVTAAGTAPLSYQWYFDGAALPQDTNSTLTLTNTQSPNSGFYSVIVSSPFGSILSSNATLTVDLFPIFFTQPQSRTVMVGINVTFSVVAADPGAGAALPTVTSGTLQLWLKADAGVVTNASGQVSQWQDQSGNANHASQANTNEQPLLVSATGLGGKPALRFNGTQDNTHGSYLAGTGAVNVANAMTTFTFYNAFSTVNNENLLWLIGVPGEVYGASRCNDIIDGELLFSTWTDQYGTPFVIPTNTYRIWIDRLDNNLDTLNMFDVSSSSATNFTASMSGTVAPAAGYYVGGLNPALTYVGSSRCFNGDIAELIYYQGYLTETDRLAVANYLEQKYYPIGASTNVSFQWQFDGTNITNATNASLTLTDVHFTNAGTYTIIVSNSAGPVTSSNALLAVGWPPRIVMQPASQSVESNCSALFSVSAKGFPPLACQWWRNGLALPNQTNSSLSFASVQGSNFGNYNVVVTNAWGAATSSVAVLALASPPVANPVTVLRFAAGGVRINASDLTTNDTVALYDDLAVIEVSSNSSAGGAVSLDAPWIYYAPPAGEAASDTFNYTVSDGHCGTATGTVTVQTQADNPQPLHFALARMGDGSLQLTFDGIPGESYHLEYSDSLSPPVWQVLSSQAADGFGVILFTDSPVTNAPARFYRAVWP